MIWAYCKYIWEAHLELPHIELEEIEEFVKLVKQRYKVIYFKLYIYAGNTYHLTKRDELRGASFRNRQITSIKFTATWCGPCKE